jgi:hypothetical protein
VDKEYWACMHNGAFLSHKDEENHAVCRKMNGTADHHDKQNKPD